jgi:hypothetical protein
VKDFAAGIGAVGGGLYTSEADRFMHLALKKRTPSQVKSFPSFPPFFFLRVYHFTLSVIIASFLSLNFLLMMIVF